jgi:ribosome-binding protein aMBF1 (putative translation factor)
VNINRQHLHGNRQLSKLIALKRGIVRMSQNFEIDSADVIATIDQRMEKVGEELTRNQQLKRASIAQFQVLEAISGLPISLIEARIVLGWSQRELAKQVSLKPQQIHRYEKSQYATIRLSKAIEIACLLERELIKRNEAIKRCENERKLNSDS